MASPVTPPSTVDGIYTYTFYCKWHKQDNSIHIGSMRFLSGTRNWLSTCFSQLMNLCTMHSLVYNKGHPFKVCIFVQQNSPPAVPPLREHYPCTSVLVSHTMLTISQIWCYGITISYRPIFCWNYFTVPYVAILDLENSRFWNAKESSWKNWRGCNSLNEGHTFLIFKLLTSSILREWNYTTSAHLQRQGGKFG